MHTLGAEKAYCLSLIYLKASDYDRLHPFGESLGVTSSHVLTSLPDLAALAAIPTDRLAAQIDAVVSAPLKGDIIKSCGLAEDRKMAYPGWGHHTSTAAEGRRKDTPWTRVPQMTSKDKFRKLGPHWTNWPEKERGA